MSHLHEIVVLSHSLVAKTVWPRAVVDSGRFVTGSGTPVETSLNVYLQPPLSVAPLVAQWLERHPYKVTVASSILAERTDLEGRLPGKELVKDSRPLSSESTMIQRGDPWEQAKRQSQLSLLDHLMTRSENPVDLFSRGSTTLASGRWRGGRVADCTGLENQQRRKTFEGSNPSPSASTRRITGLVHRACTPEVRVRVPPSALRRCFKYGVKRRS